MLEKNVCHKNWPSGIKKEEIFQKIEAFVMYIFGEPLHAAPLNKDFGAVLTDSLVQQDAVEAIPAVSSLPARCTLKNSSCDCCV